MAESRRLDATVLELILASAQFLGTGQAKDPRTVACISREDIPEGDSLVDTMGMDRTLASNLDTKYRCQYR
jgi:hypothetical protein